MKAIAASSALPFKAQAPASTNYQAFVSQRAKEGKNLKEIGAEWRALKEQ